MTLEPAADAALDAVGVAAGERLLDIACGTGNAALAAAGRGARAVGVDAAAGLIAIARERAAQLGRDAEFVAGDAGALPVADATFDAAVSVFGMIFAPDPERAAAEIVRCIRPGGRFALTSWIPAGPISDAGRLLWTALHEPASDPPRWGDPEWAVSLLADHGALDPASQERTLTFTAASPRPGSPSRRPTTRSGGGFAASSTRPAGRGCGPRASRRSLPATRRRAAFARPAATC